MAIEKERKFLYIGDHPVGFSLLCKKSQHIKQGYLMLEDGNELRVRIISERSFYQNVVAGALSAFLTYKQKISKEERYEFEYEIPYPDGRMLFELAKYKLTKTRYKTEFKGNTVDIDFYPSGLKVVEIEFDDDLTELPDYCGEELTGNKEYSNIALAMSGKEYVEKF